MKKRKKKPSASLRGWSVGYDAMSQPKRCAVKGCDNGVRDRSKDQLCRVCLDRLERGMVPIPLVRQSFLGPNARWSGDEPLTVERKLLTALVRVLSEEYLEHD